MARVWRRQDAGRSRANAHPAHGTRVARPAQVTRRVLAAWLVALAVLALLPLQGVSGPAARPWVAVVTFATILATLGRGPTIGTAISLAGNIAVFVPLGLLAPATSQRLRSWPRVLGLGLAVSLAIETAQLTAGLLIGHPYRSADVDDLILNVAGTALGYGTAMARTALGYGVAAGTPPQHRSGSSARTQPRGTGGGRDVGNP
jgi:VanZ family protein